MSKSRRGRLSDSWREHISCSCQMTHGGLIDVGFCRSWGDGRYESRWFERGRGAGDD